MSKTDSSAIAKPKTEKKIDVGKSFLSTIKTYLPFTLGAPAIIWQVLFFYLPIALLISSSIYDPQSHAITQKHFMPLLSRPYITVILNSLSLALSTSVLCLTLGFPLAYFLAFKTNRFRTLLLFLLIVPFWTNFLLHIYSWFFVLEKEGFLNLLLMNLGLIKEPIHFLNNMFATMIMMVYYYLPFMVLPIYFSLERFNSTLIEASLDLGATFNQTFRRVLLPLTMKAISGGFFLVFIPAFGEFIIPELMGGDRYYFVGNVISQFVLGEQTASIGIAFTVMSISCLVLAVAIVFMIFKQVNKLLSGGAL